jgi:sporulation protein YlmC with PRC-barrel domain
MKKWIMISIISIFSLGLMAINIFAAEPALKEGDVIYQISKLVGSEVKNTEGEDLGRINDFAMDSNGHLAFAILSYTVFWHAFEPETVEKLVAIPFSALSFVPGGNYFVLNTTRERLASAPTFKGKEDLSRGFTEEVYGHFGLQPPWTEEEHEKWMKSNEDPFDLVG